MSSSSSHFRAWVRVGGAVGAAAALTVATLIGLAPSASAATVSQTFSLTGAEESFTVPAGVTSIEVTAIGGHGANLSSASPGRAATVTGTITVTPGSLLFIRVGGNGSGTAPAFNGGGDGGNGAARGGGGSDVRTISGNDTAGLNSRLIVAGGGGGSGAFDAPGGNAGSDGSGSAALGCEGGEAGTATEGGNPGDGFAGSAGVLGFGGAGSSNTSGQLGGGGGGGLYGGGGGGATDAGGCGGGGGGGSSLVPTGGSFALAPSGSTPSVTLTYDAAPTTVTDVLVTPDPVVTGSPATVTATVDDGDAVASATYTVDGGPANAMAAADGVFDETSEGVAADADTSSLAPGGHEVCVTGTDATGNSSGGADCVTFTVLGPDTTDPTVTDVQADPTVVTAGDDELVSATVNDDRGVASARYALDGGAPIPMTVPTPGGVSAVASATIDTASLTPGSHEVCVAGVDTSANESSGDDCATFTVRATDSGGGGGGGANGNDSSGDDDSGSSLLPDTGLSALASVAGLGGLLALGFACALLMWARVERHDQL